MTLGAERAAVIANMEAMGFERAQIDAAMRAAFFNPDRAVEYLLNVRTFMKFPSKGFVADFLTRRASPRALCNNLQPPRPRQPPPSLQLRLLRSHKAVTREVRSTCSIWLHSRVEVVAVELLVAHQPRPLVARAPLADREISATSSFSAAMLSFNNSDRWFNNSPRCWSLSCNSLAPETPSSPS